MVCEACERIPLDLFLPTPVCGHAYRNGPAWLGYQYHSKLQNVEQSGADGCAMCRLFLRALSSDRSKAGILADDSERPKDTHISLRCSGKGKLQVFEHTEKFTVRTGNLYWFNQSMNLGWRSGHSVDDSSSSLSVFELARSWIDTCREKHVACNQRRDTGCLPTRLIDIRSATSEGPITSRLIHTSGLEDKGGTKYLTLSHCWGTASGGRVPKTTKASLADRLAGIDWDELSKTFQDALEITRGLCMQYIWIDSLCIIQDDEDDFQIECAKMGQVYSNAVCTIAASDSPTSDGGCFIVRDSEIINGFTLLNLNNYRQTHRPHAMTPEFDRRHEDEPASSKVQIWQNHGPFIDRIKGPLNVRGWTLQERELSPRILHYTKDQVLWECRECTASEARPEMDRKDNSQLSTEYYDPPYRRLALPWNGQRVDMSAWRLLDETSDRGAEAVLGKWYALVEAYSRRQLTQKLDKLPAISGIAAEVAFMLEGDIYAAGLWKGDIFRGLSWFPDPVLRRRAKRGAWPLPRTDDGIPSWSWAAWDGPVTHYAQNKFDESREVVVINGWRSWAISPGQIQLLGVQITHASRDPFGRVSGGRLRMSGWAIEASVSEDQYEPDFCRTGFWGKCYHLSSSFKYPSTMRLYFDADPEELPQISIVCLQVGSGLSVRRTAGDVGLVLMKVGDGNPDIYCRVGMFDVERVDRKWLSLRAKRTILVE